MTGNGSVVQLEKDKPLGKCRKWQPRVSCGRSPRTGKYVNKTRAFQGTYSQACAELRKFIDEIEGNKVKARSGYTFKAYCEHYLDVSREAAGLDETTCHLRLTQFRAICMYIDKESGTPRPRPSTPCTTRSRLGRRFRGRKSHPTISTHCTRRSPMCWSSRSRRGSSPSTPRGKPGRPRSCETNAGASRPSRRGGSSRSWIPVTPITAPTLLAVSLGLRRGEVCALSWSDIDLENRTVHVRHNLDVYGNLKEPKTKAGIRMLPMSDRVYEALSTLKRCKPNFSTHGTARRLETIRALTARPRIRRSFRTATGRGSAPTHLPAGRMSSAAASAWMGGRIASFTTRI